MGDIWIWSGFGSQLGLGENIRQAGTAQGVGYVRGDAIYDLR